MQTFLEQLASHLYKKYGNELSRVCIVFPNRRAGLFFRKFLSRLIIQPVWLPEIIALEDFVVSRTKLRLSDPLNLLADLYEAYCESETEQPKPFTDFLGWGSMLLSDFDEIDQNLANGEEVFRYIDEIKVLRHWNPDGTPLTPFEKDYLRFYNLLGTIYLNFRKRLLLKNEGYIGLIFSILIENLEEDLFREWDHIVFAGFNALAMAEEKLIMHLVSVGKGEVIWDADEYYLGDSEQESGYFLRNHRKNKNLWTEHWTGRYLEESEKSISIVGVPGNVGQAMYAGSITKRLMLTTDPSDIAIVLVDEGLMLPVMNSLPSGLDTFNITMGYPLKLTPAFSMVDDIFRLFINSIRYSRLAPRYHLNDLERIRRHPYLFAWNGSSLEVEAPIKKNRSKVFFSGEEALTWVELQMPGLAGIFKDGLIQKPIDNLGILRLMKELVAIQRDSLLSSRKKTEAVGMLDMEYLFLMNRLLERLMEFVQENAFIQGIESLYEVFNSQVSSLRIPFMGEPLSGLQLMGVLETRTLDFRNIIMLSVNEGLIPKGKQQNTFIPEEIRKSFGLQYYSERNAVFAYHFYRLLQRAENVFLLYNTEGTEMGGGEKSRFLTQLRLELPGINPGIRIEEKVLSIPPFYSAETKVSVNKNVNIMEKLMVMAENGLSPSALSRYLVCGLQFCYASVFEIIEQRPVEDSIDAATLGEVVHEVLMRVYKPYKGKHLDSSDLDSTLTKAVAEVKNVFSESYAHSEIAYGKNLLIVKVAENMVRRMILAEKAFLDQQKPAQGYLEILKLEEWLNSVITISLDGYGDVPVKIFGKADRIDRLGSIVRVIDYKTGRIDKAELTLEHLKGLREHASPSKLLQIFTYAWMFSKMQAQESAEVDDIISGIISLRFASKYLIPSNVDKREVLNKGDLKEFEEVLESLLLEIFDQDTPFVQTDNLENCKYCPYQTMCNRVLL